MLWQDDIGPVGGTEIPFVSGADRGEALVRRNDPGIDGKRLSLLPIELEPKSSTRCQFPEMMLALELKCESTPEFLQFRKKKPDG